MLKEHSTAHKVNQEAYAILFRVLMDGPATAHELAEATGLHSKTTQDLMRTLKRHHVVHISAWEPNGRGIDTTPVWSFGKGRDVPRRRKTRAQIAADYRTRKAMRQMVNAVTTPTT